MPNKARQITFGGCGINNIHVEKLNRPKEDRIGDFDSIMATEDYFI
ncbi:hypothetical protein ACFL6N_05930 [Thermodesulfobacteriota bacterium]